MSTAAIAHRVGSSPLSAGQLARARYVLTEQRRFRLDQLAELSRSGALHGSDPTAREVARSLAAGARAALTDTCEALRQLAAGRYGLCRDCRTPLAQERLDVLPHLTRCPPCLEITAHR